MNNIVLCRIDSRLVHGQVMTKWVQQSQANKIVILSDSVANDPFLLEIYKMSSPPGIEIECFSVNNGIQKWLSEGFEGKVLLLLPDLKTLKQSYEGGIKVDAIQVGGLGGGANRKVIFQNITLDDPDMEILEELNNNQVKITFQTIPEDNPMTFSDVQKKYNK